MKTVEHLHIGETYIAQDLIEALGGEDACCPRYGLEAIGNDKAQLILRDEGNGCMKLLFIRHLSPDDVT